MKASDLFVKALEVEGVECIFGVPGEENLDFIESVRKSKIRFVTTRHEQGAGFMAAIMGRLTGKAGVVLSTLGPGATNLVTPAAYAQLGGMPMLMITGQKPIKTSKQGQFQIIDVVQMMKPLTKFTKQVVNGNTIPSLVREAFRAAEEERPGAVHLELPEDISQESTTRKIYERPSLYPPRRPIADKKGILKAATMIQQANHPLLLIGAGANRKRTANMLREFVEKTGISFFNTQMGKGVIDERHPLFLGTAALSENDFLHCAIEQSDLIINVGHDVVEKPPFLMEPGGRKVIHVNFLSAKINDVYFPQLEVVGDIANAIWQIKENIVVQSSWDFGYFLTIKAELENHISHCSKASRFPLFPQRVVSDVRKSMPSDGIIALVNGIYKIWFARNYKAHQPNTILLDNALATMGAGLPSAIAAKIVNPDKKVLAICGDGEFMMNSQELETAVRLKLDLTVMILNDSAYGMIKWKQAAMGCKEFSLDFTNPDFCKYAESYGANGYKLKSSEDLKSKLQELLDTPGVNLLDVPVDYSENERVLIQELREKTCNI